MSMASALLSPPYQIPPIPVRRFSVAEYFRMLETGVLADSEKLELLDGWITPKLTRNPSHDSVLAQVDYAIAVLVPANWHVRRQSSIALPGSVPEPDLAVVAGHPR